MSRAECANMAEMYAFGAVMAKRSGLSCRGGRMEWAEREGLDVLEDFYRSIIREFSNEGTCVCGGSVFSADHGRSGV